jgi:hypothetical protein
MQRKKDDIETGRVLPVEVKSTIETEIKGENSTAGYRRMTNILRQKIGLNIKRDTVAYLQQKLDPDGVASRFQGIVTRRTYRSSGPNDVWAFDGHDKLKPFGIAIYGGVDAWSRKIVLLKVHTTNNDPRHVGYWFLQCCREAGGIPLKITTDRGSETGKMAAHQIGLYMAAKQCDLATAKTTAHKWVKSTRNQKIESFWSKLMQQKNINVINIINAAISTGVYDPEHFVQRYHIFANLALPATCSH